jgi:hypothetical protein
MSEIFFGSGLEKNEKHATRPPVGEKFNIKTITPPMIAYTATQVSVIIQDNLYLFNCYPFIQARFALSSTTSWGTDDRLFVFNEFYYAVLELFEYPDDPWVKDTLQFWNQ